LSGGVVCRPSRHGERPVHRVKFPRRKAGRDTSSREKSEKDKPPNPRARPPPPPPPWPGRQRHAVSPAPAISQRWMGRDPEREPAHRIGTSLLHSILPTETRSPHLHCASFPRPSPTSPHSFLPTRKNQICTPALPLLFLGRALAHSRIATISPALTPAPPVSKLSKSLSISAPRALNLFPFPTEQTLRSARVRTPSRLVSVGSTRAL
jgi:hypothetical protein